MMTFLMLLWLHTPTGHESLRPLGSGLTEPGYLRIPYDLNAWHAPVKLRIYAPLGCVIVLDRPYEDTWASDVRGSGGTGAHYQYTAWGVDADGAPDRRKVIIATITETHEPVNVFFQVEGRIVEVLLTQTKKMEDAQRMVFLNFSGGKQAEAARPKPKPKEAAPPGPPVEKLAGLLTQKGNRTKRTPHGKVIYNFGKGQHFVYFRVKPESPEMTVVEVVKGLKNRFARNFKFEYPLGPAERYQLGDQVFLLFPNTALAKGERLYFRWQAMGERNASFTRLFKPKR